MAKMIKIVDVPPDLLRRLKIEAATRGVTMKALVLQAIEHELARKSK